MPNAESAHITDPVAAMTTKLKPRLVSKVSQTTFVENSTARKYSEEYIYDSEDEIAASKAKETKRASTKNKTMSKVKAKLSGILPKETSSSYRKQANADMMFHFMALAETRM